MIIEETLRAEMLALERSEGLAMRQDVYLAAFAVAVGDGDHAGRDTGVPEPAADAP